MAQINKSSEYFNTVLYTGNNSTSNAITGVGFQPDLVWIKNRSAESSQLFQDSVRGKSGSNYLYLQGNDTAAEAAQGDDDGLNTIGADGFTVGYTNSVGWNASGNNYVSWNWLADNTSGSSNTDGSITSTVSANTTSGFSIVSFTGTGAVPVTVGHGLGVVPEVLIIKNRTNAYDWAVYHKDLGNTGGLFLNTTSAFTTNADLFNNTSPTNLVVTFSNSTLTNQGSANHIMYAFNSVKGFSKFGSYTGNGNDGDGTFIYTGFKPAFFMIKRTDASQPWLILDSKRGAYNVNQSKLFPNASDVENTDASNGMDFLSNGIKLRRNNNESNGSNGNYIYMAFAENPLVGTNNIPTTAR